MHSTGYRYGAHQSGNGWSGYYVIRESDGASCTGKLSPAGHVEAPTAEEINEAIKAEAADRAELDEVQS